MKDMVSYVNDFVKSVRPHETIASFVREKTKNSIGIGPKEYFFLRDLCDPLQSYYKYIGESIPIPFNIKQKMAYGNKLHKLANIWFRNVPGYLSEEGVVDGALVDVVGVRGKIDAIIGENILELKTKDGLPEENPKKILKDYMQDVEQLVFYSVLYKKPKEVNYLVFMSQKHPHEIMAFKIIVKNPHLIKEVIRDRIKKLRKAIDTKDPSSLPRCRYHGDDCPLKEKCICENLPLSENENITNNIEIYYDKEFTNKLKKYKEEAQKFEKEGNIFTTYDILFPKKYGIETDYLPDEEKNQLKNYLLGLVRRIPKFRLLSSDHNYVKKLLKEPYMIIGHRWVKILSSIGSQKEKLVPYIVTVNKTGAIRPYPYHLAELGIICAVHGKDKGFIFEISSSPQNKIRVFDIEYKNTPKIFNKIKEIIQNIRKGKIDELPPNPF